MKPLGMNRRNHLIARVNDPEHQKLARDKHAFKQVLEEAGIPTPRTYFLVRHITDLPDQDLPDEFVLKPNNGLAGRGILVLSRGTDGFTTPSGRPLSINQVKHHAQKILEGQYSGLAENDHVLVEELIRSSPDLRFDEPIGLPDIRVIVYGQPLQAMVRYPTARSDGKANLAAGAIGIGIDLQTGTLVRAWSEKTREEIPLERVGVTDGYRIPRWQEILGIACRTAELSGLTYCGVDIVLSADGRILILEANGYPGLEIQNVNLRSLLPAIS